MAISAFPEGRRSMVAAAHRLLELGLHSISKHGNLSVRAPEGDAMLLSSVSSLDSISDDTQALVGLDGAVREGKLDPIAAEIVKMHAVVYRLRSDVGGVIHTHSPHATAFAVAGKPIGRFYEGLVRWDVTDPVPVAEYGPRGSRRAVDNIARAIDSAPGCKAVLLANHGVLVFDRDLATAIRVHAGLEEAAQLALLASGIGQPRELSADDVKAAIARRDEFASTH